MLNYTDSKNPTLGLFPQDFRNSLCYLNFYCFIDCDYCVNSVFCVLFLIMLIAEDEGTPIPDIRYNASEMKVLHLFCLALHSFLIIKGCLHLEMREAYPKFLDIFLKVV